MDGIEIVVTHHFDAPAEIVFDAWLDPLTVGHSFFATPAADMKRVVFDPRIGGEFVIAEQRGDILVEHFGRYVEIDRPQRLAFTFATERDGEPSLVIVEIESDDKGCNLRLSTKLDPKWAEYADRARAGWTMILEGLHNEVSAYQYKEKQCNPIPF